MHDKNKQIKFVFVSEYIELNYTRLVYSGLNLRINDKFINKKKNIS